MCRRRTRLMNDRKKKSEPKKKKSRLIISPNLSLNTLLMNIRFLIGISYETIATAWPPRSIYTFSAFWANCATRFHATEGKIQLIFKSIAEEAEKARARWSACAPPQNSGVCAEVLAEGDHVALGISNHRFSVEPWHCLDRGGFKPSFPKLSNMVLQVVHEEREQGLAGAVGVTDHVDPSGICYLPHGFVFRHDDIWGPSEEALVPRERRVIVGNGNASEDMLDGQCSLLLAQILHNFPSGTRALPCCAFHKALELNRAMFAREGDRPLAHALVAAEVGALPHAPAGVAAEKIRVAGGVAQRGPAGIVGADTREDTLQLLQAVLGIALDVRRVIRRGICRRWPINGSSLSARIIDEQST